MYIQRHKTILYKICLANDFTKPMAADFVHTLGHLERHRGILSVVKVLKGRSQSLVSGTLGNFKMKGNQWIGCWGHFSRMSARGRRNLIKVLRILKLVGLFVHPSAKIGDYQKRAILLSAPPKYTRWIYLFNTDELNQYVGLRTKTYNTSYPLSAKRAPLRFGVKIPEILISPKEHLESLAEFPCLVSDYYDVFSTLVGTDLPDRNYYLERKKYVVDTAGYVVFLTKDRGMKLRLIANCNRMIQLALSPLHNVLVDFMKSVPECFVYSQDGGSDWVTAQLASGHPLTSLDIDAASDNIPLGPQLDLALALFPELHVEIAMFGQVARMSWRTPYKGVRIVYKCGHPMGINCSFGLFTAFLIACFYKIGAQGKFCIVGDDLVFHAEFQHEILVLFALYGVPINYSKSLLFNYTKAEFVGRVIDKHGSLNVFKASKFTKAEPLGIIRQYGPKGAILGPRRLFGLDYEDVVSSILLYQDNRELQEIVKLFLPALDYLKLSTKVPASVHIGGVSATIVEKMIAELRPVPFTPEMLKFNERLRSWGESDIPSPESELAGKIARYRMLNPGDAYAALVQLESVVQIAAFTVESNDAFVVSTYQKLKKFLTTIAEPEDGYEAIGVVESALADLGLEVKHVTDVTLMEERALAGRFTDESKYQPPGRLDGSSTFFLTKILKKAARNYRAV